MKKVRKPAVNKDVVKSRIAHSSTAPRMQPEVKNAGVRNRKKSL